MGALWVWYGGQRSAVAIRAAGGSVARHGGPTYSRDAGAGAVLMDLLVLGPLELRSGEEPVGIGAPKERAVLAILALNANTSVSVDRLIEGLWGTDPPATATKNVHNYISKLRKLLASTGDAEIVTRGRTYELRIDPGHLDLRRVERLLDEARRAAADGQHSQAAREALALWRGDSLADLSEEPFAFLEAGRLEELRLGAAELAIDADLAVGRHREVLGEIDALVAEHRLSESLHLRRMTALYRCGRQADALEAYHEARRALDEIGLQPGPELRALHEAILRQDASLDGPARFTVQLDLPAELERAAVVPLVGRSEDLAFLNDLREARGRALRGGR